MFKSANCLHSRYLLVVNDRKYPEVIDFDYSILNIVESGVKHHNP